MNEGSAGHKESVQGPKTLRLPVTGNCLFLSPFCLRIGDRMGTEWGQMTFFDYLGHSFIPISKT